MLTQGLRGTYHHNGFDIVEEGLLKLNGTDLGDRQASVKGNPQTSDKDSFACCDSPVRIPERKGGRCCCRLRYSFYHRACIVSLVVRREAHVKPLFEVSWRWDGNG